MEEKVKINVDFRKFENGEVIAIFVDKEYKKKSNGYYMSYMHIGQHGDCDPNLLNELEKANKDEYNSLKKELESLGYIVNVI